MKKLAIIPIIALIFLLVAGAGFWKWEGAKNVKVLGGNEFTYLQWDYKKNKHEVYFRDTIVEGADRETFSVWGVDLGKDKKSVFWKDRNVAEADSNSVVMISYPYWKDKNAIFLRDLKIEGADPETFSIIDKTNYLSKDKDDLFRGYQKTRAKDIENLKPLTNGYSSDGGKLYFTNELIAEDNSGGFEVLDERSGCAMGQDSFYVNGERAIKFDGASSQVLGYGYSKDKNSVYYKCNLLAGADSESFHAVDENSGNFIDRNFGYTSNRGVNEVLPLDDFWFFIYAKGGVDLGSNYRKYKDAIYYWNTNGGQAPSEMVSVFANPNAFRSINNNYCHWSKAIGNHDYCPRYGLDDARVFYKNYELKGADPKTFQLMTNQKFLKDAFSVFYNNKKIEGAESKTFKVLSNSLFDYARDKYSVFSGGQKMDGIDPETFVFLKEGYYAKDENNLLCNNKKVIDGDPGTFRIVKESDKSYEGILLAMDKNNYYSYCDKITKEELDEISRKKY